MEISFSTKMWTKLQTIFIEYNYTMRINRQIFDESSIQLFIKLMVEFNFSKKKIQMGGSAINVQQEHKVRLFFCAIQQLKSRVNK